uniref:RNA-dependent RNA polymerase n=1 Tax=Plasmopara viticola lesion associated narnavirus 31 TaxID=2719516 RepID=A0A6G9RVD0_9VIRU|nr:RNA-dependent RNA polymerase [Plasmopara viticola lesion associated narnavirus 31]
MDLCHSSLPLTVSVKRNSEVQRANGQSFTESKTFSEVLDLVSDCLSSGQAPLRDGEVLTWDYDYDNLWTSKFPCFEDDKKGRRIQFHNPKSVIRVLSKYTYWYGRLAKNTRDLLKSKIIKGSLGLLELKEYCHTVDGVLVSLMLGAPEVLRSTGGDYVKSDVIISGIMSSCIHNYTQVVKDTKRIRKELKCGYLNGIRYVPDSTLIRRNSWWTSAIELINSRLDHRSKASIFRLACLTQTRATGLASNKMVEDTIDEFVASVTSVKDFSPPKEMIDAIDKYTSDVVLNARGRASKFKISISTSACFENGQSKEGKFGQLKKLIGLNLYPPPPPLSINGKGGETGTLVFKDSLEEATKTISTIDKVNVAAIRENGKARVVTSGSFYKDALLQPFSHMTIEMCKNQSELKDSFQAGRLGWTFASKITHLDPKRGLPLFARDPLIMSFDWEKATDNPTHAMGRMLVGSLLAKTDLDPEILEKVLGVWVGEKQLYRSIKGKKLEIGTLVNGIPMGDPITKTCLSSAHPICHIYAESLLLKEHPVLWDQWVSSREYFAFGAGNGDDGVRISTGEIGRLYFKYFLQGAEILGYKNSSLDMAITSDWATYCEEWFRIPQNRFATVNNAVKLKDSRLSPYLDVPKIRLILDTKKDREDYSSDPQGKYTLLGKDMEYIAKDSSMRLNNIYSVASALQDVCLGLKDRPEPVYLPRQVFGQGKAPTGWEPRSWTNALFSQRRWPRMIATHAMKEILDNDRLITAIRGKSVSQEKHFKNQAYLEVLTIPEDDPIKEYVLVRKEQWKLFPPNVIERLVTNRRLILESQVGKQYLYSKRLEALSSGVVVADLFEVIKSMSIELTDHTREETLSIVTDFSAHYKESPWQLRFDLEEDLYPSSILTKLHESDPLRVDIDYPFLDRFKHSSPLSDTPFERALDSLEQWFKDNYIKIINGMEFELPPTEVIEDDPILMIAAERSENDLFVIVSNDVKLYRRIKNKVLNKTVARISIEHWLDVFEMSESTVFNHVKEAIAPEIKTQIEIDQGSIDTFLLSTDIAPVDRPYFDEVIIRGEPRSQEDIYNVYLPPKAVNTGNLFEFLRIDSQDLFFLRRRFRAQR